MSLPKSEISEILSAMGDILTRLIDRVEKNIEFQPFERRELLNTLYKQMCGVQIDEILAHVDNKHKLQIKRGDTDKNNTYVGQPGEITMDTDAKTIRIHDGETTGGVAMARAIDTIGDWVVESQLPTAENNYTWYRKYKSGWVEMGGLLSGRSVTFPIEFAQIPTLVFGNYSSGTSNTPQNVYNEITTAGFTGWRTRTNAGWDSGAEDWNGCWSAYGIAA
ncbi:MAG: hypothetical protein E7009_03440 [Alphaproteobacteria bacterium]|nr:hypothetical protein [Alphaproteobacteria bacterium]